MNPPHPQASEVSAPTDAAAPAATSARRHRRALVLAVLLVAMGAALLAAGAALWWTAGQPAALRWALAQLPGLSVQGVQGGLRPGPMRLAHLRWQAPGQTGTLEVDGLQIDRWSLRWRPHPGAWADVRVGSITAERVRWTSGPAPRPPATEPVSLRLPIELHIERLAVRQLQWDQWTALEAAGARLALGSDQGRLHELPEWSLHTELGSAERAATLRASGRARIGADAPFQLLANAHLDGQVSIPNNATPGAPARHWQAEVQLAGPLARLDSSARLQMAAGSADAGARADARAEIRPFERWPLGPLRLSTQALDLQTLVPAWPATRLDAQIVLQTSGRHEAAQADVRLRNGLPGRWEDQRLPVKALRLAAQGTIDQPDRLRFDDAWLQLADAETGAGELSGRGQWVGDQLELDLRLKGVALQRLWRDASAVLLDGPLSLRLQGLQGRTPLRAAIAGELDGRALAAGSPPVHLGLAAELSRGELTLTRAQARAGAASASAQARLQWSDTDWRLEGRSRFERFDPLAWWQGAQGSAWRRGPHRLQGEVRADLAGPRVTRSAGDPGLVQRLQALKGNAHLQLADSLLAGVTTQADLHWRADGAQAGLEGDLRLADNRLQLAAAGPLARWGQSPWRLKLDAPQLAALAPFEPMLTERWPDIGAAWPLAGAAQAEWTISGQGEGYRSQGQFGLRQLRTRAGSLAQADGQWTAGAGAAGALDATLQLRDLRQGDQRLDRLTATARGSWSEHRLSLQAESPLRLPAWTENLLGPAGTGSRLTLQGQGHWRPADARSGGGYQWQQGSLQLGARDAAGGSRSWLAAQDLAAVLPRAADGQWQGIRLAPGRLLLASTTALRWQTLNWDWSPGPQPDRLTVAAELERFDVAPLLARLQPAMGWGGTLSLGGRIDIRSDARLDADVVLERAGGDLHLTDELGGVQALGITELRLALSAHDGLWQFAQGLAGSSVGTLAGAQLVSTPRERRWPSAQDPLQGVLQARVSNLGAWGVWVPPGWRLAGELDTQGLIGGRLGAPELSGSMQGRQLAVRNLLQGVDWTDGELAVVLEGETTRIERGRLRGGDGELLLSGGMNLGATPTLALTLQAERFKALSRVDRRLVVSGRSTLRLDRDGLQLDGRLRADEGLFDLSRSDAPALDSDVVVLRAPNRNRAESGADAAARPATTPRPLRRAQVRLDLDLGEQLRLRGRGIDTGLRGSLQLTLPDGQPRLNGSLRTHQGRYAAYGQKLEILRGELLFNGPVDNPALDVLALRPNLDVEVGVLITGYAASPRIRLFSQPDMSDYDKLSWLMLGRGPDGLGNADTALLQRAALALLAGDQGTAAAQLLDTLGLVDFSVRQGGTDSRETIVSLGRQLSRRWYVGYERGVNATLGTWQLVYRVAQRFTLRAQSGSENAIDMIWTWRW